MADTGDSEATLTEVSPTSELPPSSEANSAAGTSAQQKGKSRSIALNLCNVVWKDQQY